MGQGIEQEGEEGRFVGIRVCLRESTSTRRLLHLAYLVTMGKFFGPGENTGVTLQWHTCNSQKPQTQISPPPFRKATARSFDPLNNTPHSPAPTSTSAIFAAFLAVAGQETPPSMAAGAWVASVPLPSRLAPIPFPAAAAASFLAPALPLRWPRRRSLAVCFVVGERVRDDSPPEETFDQSADAGDELLAEKVLAEKVSRKRSERYTYLVAAVMSSFGITSMAVAAVYYRFYWQFEGEIPISEMFGTFALSVGAAVGMELWARWAHRALWHASLWHMHESHHRPREGPFELNDVFAIINAVPAIGLLSYGFFNKGLVPGLCFGAGLGITVFGMAYMFVHDGLVHRRFPVGPIANVPYFRKVAAAHQIHHSEKFDGVPYGLFLGPKELEEVGGDEVLEKEIKKRIKMSNTSRT